MAKFHKIKLVIQGTELMKIGNTGQWAVYISTPCTRFCVKSVPGKISVRLCGMFNRAGLREVAREFFNERRKGFLPARCRQEPGEVSRTQIGSANSCTNSFKNKNLKRKEKIKCTNNILKKSKS